ncbi:MAG: phosphoketolase family protein [Bacilli bacterium]|nr:phosphoketolase family protein [Bacilli bacterium]
MLKKKELNLLNRYFNAANYLSVAQLYLKDNPLLERPLEINDVKKKIVGHFGTVPGQNFIYTHLNRIITKYDLDMIYISGPGHGGNFLVSNTYLEGSYSEIYPLVTEDKEGLKRLFKQFSFPGGISSHCAPEDVGSIHEGGELGYSLVHAFGAVLDNPNLIAACVVGDGEAETGPLATSWHLNKILNKDTDGIVLPILHLNGYKISNPTILSRISKDELISLFKGYGYEPIIVEGDNIDLMHEKMADALDYVVKKIKEIKKSKSSDRPIYPMIILKTKKGWTGPKIVDGKEVEGSFRSHQVPLLVDNDHLENLIPLENWLRSYKIDEFFDKDGKLLDDIKEIIPKGEKRMGSSKYTNGGLLRKDLLLPRLDEYMIDFDTPGSVIKQDMMELGKYLRDVIKNNPENFRIFSPDEALSNRLNHVFEVTDREFNAVIKNDEYLSNNGRVIDSVLSEHVCEGLLEGYLLTGRHGIFSSYEAFVRIIDSMASQHAKWLKVTKELPWRKEISSLNILLTSHIWQQDHNGYTHQDPGFLNHMVTKKADITRIYLPPDTNTLISTMNHVLKTKNYINVVVASKHPRMQWFNKEEALSLCEKGLDIIKWASDDNPDVVLVASGDTPTLEVFAATRLLKDNLDIRVRVVNVVDLMKLVSNKKHPHGLTDIEYNNIFTVDKPIIFAFHGYPNLIHELTYNRENRNMHVHGYLEEGTITTPFDMRVQNELDRYHLVIDALKYVDILGKDKLIDYCNDMLLKHQAYIREEGIDIKEVEDFKWR